MKVMRMMPPKDIPKNIAAVSELIENEEIKDEFLYRSDQPIRKWSIH